MINLKLLKSINMNKIDQCRIKLSRYLENGFISDYDIFRLSMKDISYGTFNSKIKNIKESLLREIYNSPFLLCDQKLSDNIKKILPAFLSARYNVELNELKLYLDNGDISKDEFEFQSEMLKFNYYDSSFEGKDIYKFGHVIGITDNKLNFK